MKRFFLMFFSFLFLVGCNSKSTNDSKVLKCSSTKTVGSTVSIQDYEIFFKKEKLDRLSMSIDVTLDDHDEVTRDNLENEVSNAFADYKNRDGVSYSSNVKDNGFNVRLDVNFSKLNDQDKASISIINYEKSYDEIKSEFENNDFSCK